MKEVIVLLILILVVGCSSGIEDESNETEEDKEALYGQALIELAEDNSTRDTADLDRRFNYLDKQINEILEEEKEMSMVQFTRIKIELDYLLMRNYEISKTNLLTNNFVKAYAVAAKIASKEEDYSGQSLSDRFYSLERNIEKLSASETELKVAEYLSVENGLNNLEEDGYPVTSKIDNLRGELFQVVIAELESAIYEYEIPEEELIEEEVIEDVTVEEPVAEVVEEVEEIPEGPQTYIIKLINGGFDTSAMKVKVGEEFTTSSMSIRLNDTIVWENARSGQYKIALLFGNRNCRGIKSGVFRTGESYNWTFNEVGTCWVSDGIFTTQAMRITVS